MFLLGFGTDLQAGLGEAAHATQLTTRWHAVMRYLKKNTSFPSKATSASCYIHRSPSFLPFHF